MGFYGLVSDNLIEMNVVLGNGTAITVSNSSEPDLWWAMRGAGHNFGIVTSFNKKIYPRTTDTWYYADMAFTQDKLEQVFQAANNVSNNGTQPKEVLFGFTYSWNTAFSTTDVSLRMLARSFIISMLMNFMLARDIHGLLLRWICRSSSTVYRAIRNHWARFHDRR